MAQRLGRRVCPIAARRIRHSRGTGRARRPGEFGRQLARGAGCTACGGTGYRGRVGLFEVLATSEPIRVLIAKRASTSALQRAAVEEGTRTLRQDGVRLCLEGVTTPHEVRRVAGAWDR